MGVFNKIDEFCGMSRIFITGSADGLGKVAAGMLVAEGHEVILHARNQRRVAEAMTAVPGAATSKMGAGAPDSLEEGAKTEAWLAISDEPAATVTGQYFYHQKPRRPLAAARETTVQEQFLKECERICGIALPA